METLSPNCWRCGFSHSGKDHWVVLPSGKVEELKDSYLLRAEDLKSLIAQKKAGK